MVPISFENWIDNRPCFNNIKAYPISKQPIKVETSTLVRSLRATSKIKQVQDFEIADMKKKGDWR